MEPPWTVAGEGSKEKDEETVERSHRKRQLDIRREESGDKVQGREEIRKTRRIMEK